MSMELGIIDKDPDYENPYAKETQEKKKVGGVFSSLSSLQHHSVLYSIPLTISWN